jgi:hypothetical protein
MRQIMHYDKEFRREVATTQSAQAPSTGGSDRMEHGNQCDPTPMLDRPGVIRRRTQPRTAARQLQNIRLGSAAANPLSKSRNQRADGDGCVEFASDAGVAHVFGLNYLIEMS